MLGFMGFGPVGVVGNGVGLSLEQCILNDESVKYLSRMLRGFEVNDETLALDLIKEVGIGGNFLAEEHTVKHFREELWPPGPAWTRETWDGWQSEGCTSMADRAACEVNRILETHRIEPIDEDLAREIDRIVECAKRELG